MATQEIDWNDVRERIRGGLNEKELTQRELAERCGVSTQTVTNWLKGKPLKAESLFRVAAELDLGVEQLAGVAPPPGDDASQLVRRIGGVRPGVAGLSRTTPDLLGLLDELETFVRKSTQP